MTLPTPTLNLSGCADFAFLPAITKKSLINFFLELSWSETSVDLLPPDFPNTCLQIITTVLLVI